MVDHQAIGRNGVNVHGQKRQANDLKIESGPDHVHAREEKITKSRNDIQNVTGDRDHVTEKDQEDIPHPLPPHHHLKKMMSYQHFG